jgi:hypothetical protein
MKGATMRIIPFALVAAALACAGCTTTAAPSQAGATQGSGTPHSPAQLKQSKTPG